MQTVIPFRITTAAPPNGFSGVLKIAAGSLPWKQARLRIVSDASATVIGFFGQPDLLAADLVKEYARFGASGMDGTSPPTWDFSFGGFGGGSPPTAFECPAGGTQHITLYGNADCRGCLIFEPVSND